MMHEELSERAVCTENSPAWICLSTVCTAPAGLVQEHAADVESIAVITGYKRQEKAFRARFAEEPGLKSISSVYFGTVDGFQVSAASSAFLHISAGPPHPNSWDSSGNVTRADAQGSRAWTDGACCTITDWEAY